MSLFRTALRTNRRLSLGIFGYLRMTATRRGIMGDSRFWWWVGMAFWAKSAFTAVFGRKPEIVSTEVLRRGQSVRVQSIGSLPRRERAAIRKAG